MTQQEAQKRIAQLSKEINHHNHLYYQESRIEISDYEFDQLLEELIRLGAYRKGSDPNVDRAIAINPELEAFLSQQRSEKTTIAEGYELLRAIVEKADREEDPA